MQPLNPVLTGSLSRPLVFPGPPTKRGSRKVILENKPCNFEAMPRDVEHVRIIIDLITKRYGIRPIRWSIVLSMTLVKQKSLCLYLSIYLCLSVSPSLFLFNLFLHQMCNVLKIETVCFPHACARIIRLKSKDNINYSI